MMRFYSLLALVLGLVMVGCDDGAGPAGDVSNDPLGIFAQSTVATYGQFYITSTWTRKNNVQTYRSGGEIYTATNHDTFVSGGVMTASGATIGEQYPGKYLSFVAPAFGTTAVWGLSGNSLAGIPAFADSLYIPAEIRILFPAVTTVSRTSPLTIQWNVDPNNDSVMVRVDDISEPPDGYTNLQYSWNAMTADNGSFIIPSSVLSNMTAGSKVKVSLVRGASKTVGTSSHRFHIYGYTVALDAYKLTP